jgi:hypothetical protein
MTDIISQIRQAQVASKAQRMSRDDKTRYLLKHGWRRVTNNRWQDSQGQRFPFGAAITEQLTRDQQTESIE